MNSYLSVIEFNMFVMKVQIDVMVVVVVCLIDTFCNESVPSFMHQILRLLLSIDLHIIVMNLQ